VSEESERVISGPEGNGAGVDPTAVALALSGASTDDANAFLRDQRVLIAEQCALAKDQRQHLHEQLKQIHLDVWEKVLSVFLRIATAFIGLAVAAGACWLIWNSASSNDLVIDAFQVPPDLAARGVSGPVVAAKLLDKIAAMQAQTVSPRPLKSYANGLPDALKVEIPETGVSLSELDRFLRQKLGHDLHIGGEMVQTDRDIALTARVGIEGSATVTGAQADMDTLLQNLAEQVYRITQPYRYAIWLIQHGRSTDGLTVFNTLATSGGPTTERAWAYNGLGATTANIQGSKIGLSLLRRGHSLDPNNIVTSANIAFNEYRLGRTQESLRDYSATLALLPTHGRDYTLPNLLATSAHVYRATVLMYQGALLEAVEQARIASETGPGIGTIPSRVLRGQIFAALHEPQAARAVLVQNAIDGSGTVVPPVWVPTSLQLNLFISLELQDWPGMVATYGALPQIVTRHPDRLTMFDPFVALALAHMGQFAAAEARLKPSPADCYPCLRARAQVAALQRQDGRADWWFARAAAIGPSIPYAESEWGQALLDRGQPDAAIAQFTIGNQKGPHFADPLEGWGEALMTKNQSHLALAKFAEAEKYAPNWGRLHLKWGEALFYAGKPDEAKAQFAHAAQLDLTPSEKSELARLLGKA
jgi:tetratricopeptide (TPR) repeat protein